MVGRDAGEVIHEAAMALRFRARLQDFIELLHVYPTMAEALEIAAMLGLGMGHSRFRDGPRRRGDRRSVVLTPDNGNRYIGIWPVRPGIGLQSVGG